MVGSIKTNLYNLDRPGLEDWVAERGHLRQHALTIWHALYRDRISDPAELSEVPNVPKALAAICLEQTLIPAAVEHTCIKSSDGLTQKFLLAAHPERPGREDAIETVIMAFRDRFTACVSSQAGCAMGCVFCATGQMGFRRHLETAEIVAQVMHVIRDLATRREELRNIVFMGMGEPLHNYDAVMRSIDILTDDHGIALSPRHITVSTVGLPRRIRQLADDDRPIHLAVSLHGATEAERQALVPIARKYSLIEVMDACREYTTKRRRRIFFEWALISGENDTPEQALALAELLGDMPCTVNVIPLNPTNGYGGDASSIERIDAFRQVLFDHNIRSTLRQRRGIDVAAGCGQLANAP